MEAGFSLKDSTIGIFGLGLMGGSLALALQGRCSRLIGFDSDPATLDLAVAKNIVNQAQSIVPGGLLQVIERIDLLILATPVFAILDILQRLPSMTSHPCIILDVGSTKAQVLAAMESLPECFEPIGGHPICGKETLGLRNADGSLYQGAPFVITPLARTTGRAKSAATQIISAIGAHAIELSAADHDRILASTSHLPFLLSSALALSTSQEFTPFVGTGFKSTSRLAGTPAHMMMGILKLNRDNILTAIKNFRMSLGEMEAALQNETYSELEQILNRSRASYLTLTESS